MNYWKVIIDIYDESLNKLRHPKWDKRPLATNSKSVAPLCIVSCSSCNSIKDQEWSQLEHVKITWKGLDIFLLLKTTSLRHYQIDQHKALAPNKIIFFVDLGTPLSQLPTIFLAFWGGGILKAKKTQRHIHCVIWQSKKRCCMVSCLLRKQHWFSPPHFLFARLSFVRITFLCKNHIKTLTFKGIFKSN